MNVHVEFMGVHDYPETAWLILYDREGQCMPLPAMHISKQPFMRSADGWQIDFVVSRETLGYASRFRLGIERTEYPPDGVVCFSNSCPGGYPRNYRLNLGVSMMEKTQAVII